MGSGRARTLQAEWQSPGVPYGTHSNHTKFEGPDPEYWCHKGYAVANYDVRGVGNSEGDIYCWGSQEGRDGYDLVEWLAKQKWCNGKVGMAGNSALSMAQWRIAAEYPPHLACIAPWEGTADIYREFVNMGGFTECGFNPFLVAHIVGKGLVEDYYTMTQNYPLFNAYWEDKVPAFENDSSRHTSRWAGIIFIIAARPTVSGISARHKNGCAPTGNSSGRISIPRKYRRPDPFL